ncbi:MAG: cyclophilin-like family protein [Candidatus Scalindua sp.]
MNTWGEEIYFEIPVKSVLDDTAKEVVGKGDLGYWPTGKAFCIFFGPTPASQGDEIRPASAVNIVGRVEGDVEMFKSVRDGTNIKLERVRIK